jgi:peptidyl-prolyl cis-trans isomerase C
MIALMIKSACLAAALLGLLVAGGCSRGGSSSAATQSPDASNVVAVVGGQSVTAEEFREQLAQIMRRSGSDLPGPAERREALDRAALDAAIYAQALAAGFDQSEEIRRKVRALISAHYKERAQPPLNRGVTEPEIQAYYDAHREDFRSSAAVRGAVIYLSAPAKADEERHQQHLEQARVVLEEARRASPAEFEALVAQRSADNATRYRGGDTGWIRTGQGPEPAIEAALQQAGAPGDFTPLVRLQNHWCIVRLTDRQESGFKPLAEVRDAIRFRILRQRAEQAEMDFAAQMKNGLEIRVNQALVDKIQLDAPAAPPATPESVSLAGPASR